MISPHSRPAPLVLLLQPKPFPLQLFLGGRRGGSNQIKLSLKTNVASSQASSTNARLFARLKTTVFCVRKPTPASVRLRFQTASRCRSSARPAGFPSTSGPRGLFSSLGIARSHNAATCLMHKSDPRSGVRGPCNGSRVGMAWTPCPALWVPSLTRLRKPIAMTAALLPNARRQKPISLSAGTGAYAMLLPLFSSGSYFSPLYINNELCRIFTFQNANAFFLGLMQREKKTTLCFKELK